MMKRKKKKQNVGINSVGVNEMRRKINEKIRSKRTAKIKIYNSHLLINNITNTLTVKESG